MCKCKNRKIGEIPAIKKDVKKIVDSPGVNTTKNYIGEFNQRDIFEDNSGDKKRIIKN